MRSLEATTKRLSVALHDMAILGHLLIGELWVGDDRGAQKSHNGDLEKLGDAHCDEQVKRAAWVSRKGTSGAKGRGCGVVLGKEIAEGGRSNLAGAYIHTPMETAVEASAGQTLA